MIETFAPRALYLSFYEDDYSDVCSCEEQCTNETDTKYVRGDIADDLLAACEAAFDVIPRYEPKPERLEIWHQLKAVIAKAKGEVVP